jgi:hypothetical protein
VKDSVYIGQQQDPGVVDGLEPYTTNPCAPLVNAGARGALVHRGQNKSAIFGDELKSSCTMLDKVPLAKVKGLLKCLSVWVG